MPKPIDYTAWRFWFDVLQLVGTIAIGIYVWWANREKVNSSRFRGLQDQVTEKIGREEVRQIMTKHEAACHRHREQTGNLDATLRGLQSEVHHLPSRSEIKGLNDNITDLAGKMGKLEGRLEGINRAADLMNEFLINQGGRK